MVVYVYSPIVLGRGSYRKLVRTVYTQQQLCYDAAQVLRVVATAQLPTLVLGCLVINTMLCYSPGSCFMPRKRHDDIVDVTRCI